MQSRAGLSQPGHELHRHEEDEQKAWNNMQAGQIRPTREVQVKSGKRRQPAGGHGFECNETTGGCGRADGTRGR